MLIYQAMALVNLDHRLDLVVMVLPVSALIGGSRMAEGDGVVFAQIGEQIVGGALGPARLLGRHRKDWRAAAGDHDVPVTVGIKHAALVGVERGEPSRMQEQVCR